MSDDFDFNADDLFDDFDDDDDGFGDFDDFDNNNVIGDDGGDDFGFDDFDDFDNNTSFDDDDFGADLDLGFIDGDDDDEFGGEEDEFAGTEQQSSGPSGTFITIAAVFIILLLGGLGAVGFLIFQGNQATQATQVAFNATATVRVATNVAVETGIALSETAAVEAMTATAEANSTSTAEAIDMATENAAATATAIEEEAQEATAVAEAQIAEATASAEAAAQEATNTAEDAFSAGETQTAIAIEQTLNPPEPTVDPDLIPTQVPADSDPNSADVLQTAIAGTQAVDPEAVVDEEELLAQIEGTAQAVDEAGGVPTVQPPVDVPAVQLTAQALETLFAATPTPDTEAQPTEDPGTGGGGDPDVEATTPPVDLGTGGGGELPDTGLFDDVFGGNPMTIVLAAFGLVGIIVVSRGVRTVARKED
ncbi:MAG: hypothetical protein AAFQ52_00330 [Chloroflexota bacterium]